MTDPILGYIAGPFSATDRAGVELNIQAAAALGIEVAMLGAMPVIPHANTSHPDFEKVQPYQFWIAGTMALLRACAFCIMVPGWEKSGGARGERDEMIRLGRPVFYSVEELSHWLRVVELLSGCRRDELQDHAFGDAEIRWSLPSGLEVATGYRGRPARSVSVDDGTVKSEWDGPFADHLLRLGKLGTVERNDECDDREDIDF